MGNDGDSYEYQRLSAGARQLRVLQLEQGCDPSSGFHDLRFRVKVIRVPYPRDGPAGVHVGILDYYAISYAWGDVSYPKDLIYLDGKAIRIPDSAEEALRGILVAMAKAGLAAHSTHIWIDAVCINQDDQAEKERQVAMMGDVYSSAKGVLVWWGPRHDEKVSLLASIREDVRQNRRQHKVRWQRYRDDVRWDHYWDDVRQNHYGEDVPQNSSLGSARLNYYWSSVRQRRVQDNTPPGRNRSGVRLNRFLHDPQQGRPWDALQRWRDWDTKRRDRYVDEHRENVCQLLQGRWFSRLWVVQEIVLAREVHCFQGEDYIPWREFATAVRRAKDGSAGIVSAEDYLDLLSASVLCDLRASRIRPLSQLFGLNLTRNTRDPSDRVFAILGMIQSSDLSISPDYSLPLVDLYADTVFATMKSDGSLEMLWHAAIAQRCQPTMTTNPPSAPEWPTWLTRLDALDGVWNIRCAAMLGPSFNASRGTSPVLERVPHSNRICVAGIVVGEVQGVHALVPCCKTYDDQARRDLALRIVFLRKQALRSQEPHLGHRTEFVPTNDVIDCMANLTEPDTLHALGFQWSRENFEAIAHALGNSRDSSDGNLQDDVHVLAHLMVGAGQDEARPDDAGLNEVLRDYRTLQVNAPKVQEFQARMTDAFYIGSLIRMRGGRFGITTNSVLPGDKICLVFGQAAPLVLRPCGDGWLLQGVARVHGIMQGELIKQLQTDGSLSRKTMMFELH